MAEKDMMGKLAVWAFIGGLLLAVVFGIYQAYTMESTTANVFFGTDMGGWVAWVLAILGAIVGLLAFLGKGTITSKEVPAFLLAGIALLVMYGVFGGLAGLITPYIGSLLAGVSLAVAIFIAPAVALLAIKAVWDIGKEV
jgi:predicted outer membrane lipoprotein